MKRLSSSDQGTTQIHNVADPTSAQDAATKNYADNKVSKTGDTMTGDLNVTTNVKIGAAGTAAQALDVTGQVLSSSFFRTNSGIVNNASGNNAAVNTTTTGITVTRNVADGNPSLTVQQISATSTGDLLRLKNSAITPLTVDINGQTILNGNSSAHILKVAPTGSTSASTTTGGALMLDNTGNNGSGFLCYSNNGATATGRLFDINIPNVAFPNAGVHIDYAGTAAAVEISSTSTGTNAQALNVVSTNPNDTTLGVNGSELSKGTIKAVHTGTGNDANASAISLRANGVGTAAQGIYFDAENGGTTGALIKMRNNGVDKFVVDSNGNTTTTNISMSGATSGTTTLAPQAVASGTLSLPAATDTLVGRATTDTLTNKRITKRVSVGTTSTNVTPPSDTADVYVLTAQASAITFTNPSGTPTDGQQILIRIKATGAFAITYGTLYLSSGVATLPTTTVSGKTISFGLIYDALAIKWICMAVDAIGY